eukprot:sb/3467017/
MGHSDLLDVRIMRNGTAVNLILLFAALGVIKSITTVALIWEAIDLVAEKLESLLELPTVQLEKLGARKLVPINKGTPNRFLVVETTSAIVRDPCEPHVMTSCREAYVENRNILESISAKNLAKFKPLILISGLVLEDAAETVLEYFYVDMYLQRKNTLVIINATLAAIAATISVFIELKNLATSKSAVRDMFYSHSDRFACFVTLLLYLPVVSGTLGQAMRAYLTCDQSYRGTIRPECFEVEDGALIQVPFSCARGSEWVMLASIGLGVVIGLACLVVFLGVMLQRKLCGGGKSAVQPVTMVEELSVGAANPI